jgi:hypothetical protein
MRPEEVVELLSDFFGHMVDVNLRNQFAKPPSDHLCSRSEESNGSPWRLNESRK